MVLVQVVGVDVLELDQRFLLALAFVHNDLGVVVDREWSLDMLRNQEGLRLVFPSEQLVLDVLKVHIFR